MDRGPWNGTPGRPGFNPANQGDTGAMKYPPGLNSLHASEFYSNLFLYFVYIDCQITGL